MWFIALGIKQLPGIKRRDNSILLLKEVSDINVCVLSMANKFS